MRVAEDFQGDCGRGAKRLRVLILTSIFSCDNVGQSLFQILLSKYSLCASMKKFKTKTFSGNTFYRLSPDRRFRGRHLLIILLIVGAGFGLYRKVYRQKENPLQQRPAIGTTVSEPADPAPQAVAIPAVPEVSDPFEVRRIVLHSGDSLAGIFKEAGIGDVYSDVCNACKSAQLDRFKRK